MKVFIWDFDQTFFNTPTMEDGKMIWLEKTGSEWKHKGWWARRETLDTTIFDIPMNPWIHEEYTKNQNDESIHYLVTGRIEILKEQVRKIVDDNKLVFADVFCNNSGKETLHFKLAKFKELADKHNATELYIYDDRESHLPIFVEKVKEFENVKTVIIDSVKQIQIN